MPSFGQTLNGGVRSPAERWDTLYYPVATSSTEVIVDAIGCIGVCIETWMGFEERRRIEMQKEVVLRLLDRVGVLPFGRHDSVRAGAA